MDSMYRSIKYLGLVLVMLLGLYPIAELTRVIIVSGTFYFPDMNGQFTAEIAIMWTLYLCIIPIFLLINSRKIRYYLRARKETLKRDGRQSLSISKENAGFIRVDYNH
jgi:hypothetical protein